MFSSLFTPPPYYDEGFKEFQPLFRSAAYEIMSTSLIFASNSLYDNTITCEDFGIRYQVSRNSEGIVIIQRCDIKTNLTTPIYEVKMPYFTKDIYRKAGEADWQPVNWFLRKADINPFSNTRTFHGSDGQEYQWETLERRVLLFARSKSSSKASPLARYNWAHARGEPSSLEIVDSSVLQSLDIIILTFLVFEKSRRDRHRRRHGGVFSAVMM